MRSSGRKKEYVSAIEQRLACARSAKKLGADGGALRSRPAETVITEDDQSKPDEAEANCVGLREGFAVDEGCETQRNCRCDVLKHADGDERELLGGRMKKEEWGDGE